MYTTKLYIGIIYFVLLFPWYYILYLGAKKKFFGIREMQNGNRTHNNKENLVENVTPGRSATEVCNVLYLYYIYTYNIRYLFSSSCVLLLYSLLM